MQTFIIVSLMILVLIIVILYVHQIIKHSHLEENLRTVFNNLKNINAYINKISEDKVQSPNVSDLITDTAIKNKEALEKVVFVPKYNTDHLDKYNREFKELQELLIKSITAANNQANENVTNSNTENTITNNIIIDTCNNTETIYYIDKQSQSRESFSKDVNEMNINNLEVEDNIDIDYMSNGYNKCSVCTSREINANPNIEPCKTCEASGTRCNFIRDVKFQDCGNCKHYDKSFTEDPCSDCVNNSEFVFHEE